MSAEGVWLSGQNIEPLRSAHEVGAWKYVSRYIASHCHMWICFIREWMKRLAAGVWKSYPSTGSVWDTHARTRARAHPRTHARTHAHTHTENRTRPWLQSKSKICQIILCNESHWNVYSHKINEYHLFFLFFFFFWLSGDRDFLGFVGTRDVDLALIEYLSARLASFVTDIWLSPSMSSGIKQILIIIFYIFFK